MQPPVAAPVASASAAASSADPSRSRSTAAAGGGAASVTTPSTAPATAKPHKLCVFVGQLPFDTTQKEVEALFRTQLEGVCMCRVESVSELPVVGRHSDREVVWTYKCTR